MHYLDLHVYSFWNFLTPTDEDLVRLGSSNDGGYLVPPQVLGVNLLSFGIDDNCDFEVDWLSHNKQSLINMYDCDDVTVKNSPLTKVTEHSNVNFYEREISASNISQTLDEMGQDKFFLKMDIEGGEYSVLDEIAKRDNIIGIAIEFHEAIFNFRETFKAQVKMLREKFNIVHIHANNYSPNNDSQMTNVVEITFLAKDLCTTDKKRYESYHQLDTPNDPDGLVEFRFHFHD